MIYDPLFILSLIGMFACLTFWVRNSIKESDDFAFIIKNLSTISTAFGLLMLYSIFIYSVKPNSSALFVNISAFTK